MRQKLSTIPRRDWIMAVLFSLLVILPAAFFWDVPLSRDQGVYAACADSLLAGEPTFSGCWDTKAPAQHYTYALSYLIFGSYTGGIYILNTIAIAATGLLLARLSYRWFAHRIFAYGTGLLYGLLAISVRFEMNAQPESFANLFGILGLLLLTKAAQEDRPRFYFSGGVALALTVFYKYALLLPFGAAALALIFSIPHPKPILFKDRLRYFGMTLGPSLAILLIFAVYLALVGTLDDAILHLRFIFFYFPKAQLNPDELALRSQPFRQTLDYFARIPAIMLFAIAGVGYAGIKRRWTTIPILSYMLASIIVVWGQQRFTPYHWTVMLPALALAIGAGYVEFRRRFSTDKIFNALAIIGSMIILFNVGVFFYQDQWLVLGNHLTGKVDDQDFYETFGVWDQMVVSDYIRERTEPDDTIWVWGHHAAIYHLAERRSPTRFIYNEPLLMRIEGGHPYQDEWQAEALDDIYSDPPTYIVLTLFGRTFFDFQNPEESFYSIPEYKTFLERYYIMEFSYQRFQVWRLKPYWGRQNDQELLEAITLFDLIEIFEAGGATIIQESDPPISITSFTVPPEPAYDTILMQPDAELQYTLDLPERTTCLRFDLALFPDSWAWDGDGVDFIISIETGDGESQTLFEWNLSIDPLDQHWHTHLIDLSAYHGIVTLTLETTPGAVGDYVGDWAGWSLPRIVYPPAGINCNTNAIIDLR